VKYSGLYTADAVSKYGMARTRVLTRICEAYRVFWGSSCDWQSSIFFLSRSAFQNIVSLLLRSRSGFCRIVFWICGTHHRKNLLMTKSFLALGHYPLLVQI